MILGSPFVQFVTRGPGVRRVSRVPIRSICLAGLPTGSLGRLSLPCLGAPLELARPSSLRSPCRRARYRLVRFVTCERGGA